MKIRPTWAELFHADTETQRDRQTERRTHMIKLIFAFRNFEHTYTNRTKSKKKKKSAKYELKIADPELI